mmetsp:Transcript_9663/g.15915  ORF Transcript_9663/g.15915 Transcript_9663/m.15915 type:complete len:284 (+) Transcript_9663:235-1086(+)
MIPDIELQRIFRVVGRDNMLMVPLRVQSVLQCGRLECVLRISTILPGDFASAEWIGAVCIISIFQPLGAHYGDGKLWEVSDVGCVLLSTYHFRLFPLLLLQLLSPPLLRWLLLSMQAWPWPLHSEPNAVVAPAQLTDDRDLPLKRLSIELPRALTISQRIERILLPTFQVGERLAINDVKNFFASIFLPHAIQFLSKPNTHLRTVPLQPSIVQQFGLHFLSLYAPRILLFNDRCELDLSSSVLCGDSGAFDGVNFSVPFFVPCSSYGPQQPTFSSLRGVVRLP